MISREEAIKILSEWLALAEERGSYYGEEAIPTYKLAIEALEKRIPKKPKEFEDKYYTCPECGNLLMYKWMVYPENLMPRRYGLPCCLNCLQAIDWSDGE